MATIHASKIAPPTLPWLDVSHRIAELANGVFRNLDHRPHRAWIDSSRNWCCQVHHLPNGWIRVGISYKPRPYLDYEIVVNWSTIQAIKEALFPERLAIECYPKPGDVVDAAPMRWLFIAPPGYQLPVNLQVDVEHLVG